MLAALMFAAALSGQGVTGPTDCPATPETRAWSEAERGVQCFVGWLYGPGTLETVTPLGDEAAMVFTPSVLALMAEAREREDTAAFDADPVCQCQDPGGLRLLTSTVLAADADRAVVQVMFDFKGALSAAAPDLDSEETVRLVLTLRRSDAGWRIDDILPLHAWNFRRGLREG